MPILDWLGKKDALKQAGNTPYRVLAEDASLSYGTAMPGNMLIQGDNLQALKALLPYYKGRIKCVYIDPPYNTGYAFEHYDDNLEHSQWLSLMYPRLELLRELLAEDGSLWVSIDDDECHYLKAICDEIFGRKNFVNNIIWQKKYSPQSDAKWFSDNHDHILCYARDKEIWRPNLLPRTEKMNQRYKNPDNDPRGVWKPGDCLVKTYSANTDYPITTPSGRIVNPPAGSCWRFPKEKFEELVADNRIWFGAKGTNVPSVKRFLSEVKQGKTPLTIWTYEEVGHNQDAKEEVKQFNAQDVFETPKPERLIDRIITLATNPGDIVLDSFLGSGTTAAVAHKTGRRYIGIEMGNHAITHCVPRLKAVIDGTDKGGISASANWHGGGGFAFYRLGSTLFDASGNINADVSFKELAFHVWFSETKTPLPEYKYSPMLGIHKGTAYYLLYNGILGDKSASGGNALTSKVLETLPHYGGEKIIYGFSCRLHEERLMREHIIFRQIPYHIQAR